MATIDKVGVPKAPLFSGRTKTLGILGIAAVGFVLFMAASVSIGGHMGGPTYISPGNIGFILIYSQVDTSI